MTQWPSDTPESALRALDQVGAHLEANREELRALRLMCQVVVQQAEKQGISQLEMSRRLGVSALTIRRWLDAELPEGAEMSFEESGDE